MVAGRALRQADQFHRSADVDSDPESETPDAEGVVPPVSH